MENFVARDSGTFNLELIFLVYDFNCLCLDSKGYVHRYFKGPDFLIIVQ